MKLPEFLIDHRDGEIRLTGHRIALTDIIELYREGYSPEMMSLTYPTLSLPLVYNVVAFYLNNKQACDKYAQWHKRDTERIHKKYRHLIKPITVAEVRKRIAQLHKARSRKSA